MARPERASLPALGCIQRDQVLPDADISIEAPDQLLEDGYAASMWELDGS